MYIVSIIVIIFLFIYWYGGYYRLDKLDRYSIYYFTKKNNLKDFSFSLGTWLHNLIYVSMIPFKKKKFFSQFSEGGLYSSYLYKYHPDIYQKFDNKLFWAKTFNQHNIPHPKIYGVNIKGKKRINPGVKLNKNYIVKPIQGTLGYDVNKIRGVEVVSFLNEYNNFLVQEKLNDCIYKKARHFRYVTLYTGEQFCLWELKALDKNQVASNHAQNAQVNLCKDFKCKNLSLLEQQSLERTMNKLKKLHKEKFPMVISFGWDIMINCENDNTIKAYCLEGNTAHSTWFYPEKVDNKMIKDYKMIAYKFWKDHNYI